jgi:carbon-monoxide dehydrogenase medium subunit
MKAPVLRYLAPRTVDEALGLLGETENARILAGGQSLVAMLNMRFAFPDCLIDINRIPELAYIRAMESGGEGGGEGVIDIGAMTRQREVEYSGLVARRLPLWREAVLHVGHRQTRNRGTVGGSLCQLDPSAEIPTVAMAMDATLVVRSVRGTREISMADFPAAYMTPAVDPDEMVTAVRVRPWPDRHGHAFVEFARRHGDFAIVSCAALVMLDDQGRVERASLTLGGVSIAPVRMREAESVLSGRVPDDETLALAATLCGQVDATGDSYVPAWYRRRLAAVLARRALDQAVARAKAGGDGAGDRLAGDRMAADGMAGDRMADDGMAGGGMAGDGMAGDGMAGDGMAGDGMADGGIPGDGIPGDGVPGHGVPGHGMAGDGVRGKGGQHHER